jgi:hypothetical protein
LKKRLWESRSTPTLGTPAAGPEEKFYTQKLQFPCSIRAKKLQKEDTFLLLIPAVSICLIS